MIEKRHSDGTAGSTDSLSELARIEAAVAANPKLRPVGTWNPDITGSIDIRIAADGSWYYRGGIIGRQRMVRLFASILRREEDGSHCLVTPAERLSIEVEDAPFVAVHMDAAGAGKAQVIGFRTTVGDYVKVDASHPMRFAREADTDGLKPYVCVRDRLEALVNRPCAHDLMELACVDQVAGEAWFGVWSCDTFFPIARESEAA